MALSGDQGPQHSVQNKTGPEASPTLSFLCNGGVHFQRQNPGTGHRVILKRIAADVTGNVFVVNLGGVSLDDYDDNFEFSEFLISQNN